MEIIKVINRWYQVFIAFTAATGTIFTQSKPEWAPFTLWLRALVSISKSVIPSMLHTDQDLFALDGLMDFYNRYKVEMETLFHSFDSGYITDMEALDKLSDLKKDISCSEIKPPKKKCDKAKEGVPSVTMRKIPPSSPIQPPTKPSGRDSRKK